MDAQPINHCYWVKPGQLLAGEYPRDKDEATSQAKIDSLLRAGVTVFIDLTDQRDHLEPYSGMIGDAVHLPFPIRDVSIPKSHDYTTRILDTIDRHLEAGDTVYVHCWGGIGRTGVIVGCWLARHGEPGEAALAQLRTLWQQNPKSATRRSPETWEQERYVVNWAEA
jgi:protein-tyrosine phosphatase